MSYNTSSRSDSAAVGQVIAGLLTAGVMFVLGYTVVRAGLAQSATSLPTTDADVVVPHEGTLWSDVGTQF